MKEFFSRRPSRIELLVTTSIVVLFMWTPKNITLALGLVWFVFMIWVVAQGDKAMVNTMFYAIWLAFVLSIFSPLDFTIRQGSEFSSKIVDVYLVHGTAGSVRQAAETKGLVENKDFVIYQCPFEPIVPPRTTILVTYPKT